MLQPPNDLMLQHRHLRAPCRQHVPFLCRGCKLRRQPDGVATLDEVRAHDRKAYLVLASPHANSTSCSLDITVKAPPVRAQTRAADRVEAGDGGVDGRVGGGHGQCSREEDGERGCGEEVPVRGPPGRLQRRRPLPPPRSTRHRRPGSRGGARHAQPRLRPPRFACRLEHSAHAVAADLDAVPSAVSRAASEATEELAVAPVRPDPGRRACCLWP